MSKRTYSTKLTAFPGQPSGGRVARRRQPSHQEGRLGRRRGGRHSQKGSSSTLSTYSYVPGQGQGSRGSKIPKLLRITL